MCGPFVAFYGSADAYQGAGPARDAHRPPRRTHLAYHLGRLLSYVMLGVAAGAFGAGVDHLGALAGVVRLAAIAAGLMMVLWGTATILTTLGVRLPARQAQAWAMRPLLSAAARARRWPPVARAGGLGLTTALLPCGWLYAFVAVAAGTGSPVGGALAMLVFWTGTVPALVALGLGVQRLAGPLRVRLPVVTAAVVVILGVITIGGRLRDHTHPRSASAPAAAHAEHR